jgi:hypothetical protein
MQNRCDRHERQVLEISPKLGDTLLWQQFKRVRNEIGFRLVVQIQAQFRHRRAGNLFQNSAGAAGADSAGAGTNSPGTANYQVNRAHCVAVTVRIAPPSRRSHILSKKSGGPAVVSRVPWVVAAFPNDLGPLARKREQVSCRNHIDVVEIATILAGRR